MTVGGGATTGDVTGLQTDQRYMCNVLSQLADVDGNNFMMRAESGQVGAFTYPDCEYMLQ